MGPYKHGCGCCNQNRSLYSGVLILYGCLLSLVLLCMHYEQSINMSEETSISNLIVENMW